MTRCIKWKFPFCEILFSGLKGPTSLLCTECFWALYLLCPHIWINRHATCAAQYAIWITGPGWILYYLNQNISSTILLQVWMYVYCIQTLKRSVWSTDKSILNNECVGCVVYETFFYFIFELNVFLLILSTAHILQPAQCSTKYHAYIWA